MLAQFSGLQHDSHFSFASATVPNPAPSAASTANDPLAVTRLSDLLPLVLERYGYAPADEERAASERCRSQKSRAETNRPDIARGRRRVG